MMAIEMLKPGRDLQRVKNRGPRVKPQKLIYTFMGQVEEEETHKGVEGRASEVVQNRRVVSFIPREAFKEGGGHQ